MRSTIGILSKLQCYVNINILINLYYSLIYPFLIYGIIVWGNTYPTTLQPLYISQKKVLRIITFSRFDEHSTPLFKLLNIIKLCDLVPFHISIIMFKFHNNLILHFYFQLMPFLLKQEMFINIILEPQQIDHTTCLEQELIMDCSTFNFMVQKCGTLQQKI